MNLRVFIYSKNDDFVNFYNNNKLQDIQVNQ